MPDLETESRVLPMLKIAADKVEFNEKGNKSPQYLKEKYRTEG